jgi:hypothetical protein
MGMRGRPPVLDHVKKGQILAILGVGCSRRIAARYVGCSPRTIQNTADREPEFAKQLRRADHGAEIEYLKRIRTAAQKEQYWRAAAWALERLNPEDFARRPLGMLTLGQVKTLMTRLAEIVLAEIPVADRRKRVLKAVDRLLAAIEPVPLQPPTEKQQDDGA